MGFLGLGYVLAKFTQERSQPTDTFFNSLDAHTQLLLQAQLLTPFALTDHHQQAVTLFSFNKKWTFLYFGYTHCHSDCPQTLQVLKQVYDLIETAEEVKNTQVLFITVDPQRDTVEQLANYVPYFSRHFLGVTGELNPLTQLTQSLSVTYQRVSKHGSENDYTLDHTTSIFLIDPLGRLRARFLPPHVTNIIVSDFRKIREHYAEECCLPSEPLKTIFIKGR
jgi:protein SCO1